jgi:phenylalanyl-tRNA synthetase alpha chain
MNIEDLSKELSSVAIQNETELEQFRIRFLGSKNILKDLYAALKDIPNDQKRAYGQQVNELKQKAEEIYAAAKAAFTVAQNQSQKEDLSKPASDPGVGSHHPLSLIRREIVEIFNRIGFVVSEGPEIEDDWHNFSALNFPPEHPARDMQDTFFIEKGEQEWALRTHTSSVQVRVMEHEKPPIRTISPKRSHFCACTLFLSSGGRLVHRSKCLFCRPQTNAFVFCPRTFRRTNKNSPQTILFPFY